MQRNASCRIVNAPGHGTTRGDGPPVLKADGGFSPDGTTLGFLRPRKRSPERQPGGETAGNVSKLPASLAGQIPHQLLVDQNEILPPEVLDDVLDVGVEELGPLLLSQLFRYGCALRLERFFVKGSLFHDLEDDVLARHQNRSAYAAGLKAERLFVNLRRKPEVVVDVDALAEEVRSGQAQSRFGGGRLEILPLGRDGPKERLGVIPRQLVGLLPAVLRDHLFPDFLERRYP